MPITSNISGGAKPLKPEEISTEVEAKVSEHNTDIEAHADIRTAISGVQIAANEYTDIKVAELVGGAPETLDTLKEVHDALEENADVVEALNAAIGNKSDKGHTHTAAEVGAVPTSRTVNGKALSGDISLAAADVGAAASNHTQAVTAGGTGGTSAPAGLYNLVNGSTALASTGLATNDIVGIGDVSAATAKKVTLTDLASFIVAQSGVKIQSGSYTGTGTTQEPNRLTFNFKPALVVVSPHDNSSVNSSNATNYGGYVWLYGTTAGQSSQSGTGSNGWTRGVTLTWSENTLSWTSANNASHQLNNSGAVYNYVAIG